MGSERESKIGTKRKLSRVDICEEKWYTQEYCYEKGESNTVKIQ